MDDAERSKFVGAYTKLLTNAWTDEAYMQRVRSDPKEVLEEVGLSVPAGVTVDIHDKVEGEGTLDDQVALWEQGISSGEIQLYVPAEPQFVAGELSEEDLENIAGGVGDIYTCCSCTPCCCCT